MTMLTVNTVEIAGIFAGEMALANANYFESPPRTYVADEDGKTYRYKNYTNSNLYQKGRYERNVLRQCILSVADRFAQATQAPRRKLLMDVGEPFNRTVFYMLCGLTPSGELEE